MTAAAAPAAPAAPEPAAADTRYTLRPGAPSTDGALVILGAGLNLARPLAAVLCLLSSGNGAYAGDTAYFGSTGLLGAPSADAMDEGLAVFGVNNHHPNFASGGPEVDNYFISLGIWPGLEVTGRVVAEDKPPGIVENRDLSLDVKYGIRLFDGGPRLAVGAQDLGGEAQHYRSRFVVATWPWRSLSATVGYGFGPDILDGAFGGLEWAPLPYLSFVADHDASDVNAGVRLSTGDLLGRTRLAVTASHNAASEEAEFGLTLRFPLGADRTSRSGRPFLPTAATPVPAPSPAAEPGPATAGSDERLAALAQRLEALGFESIRVGTRPDGTVVVVIENRTYNHSFLDAVGVALAAAAEALGPDDRPVEITLTRHEVPQLRVGVRLEEYRRYLEGTRVAPSWSAAYVDTVADAASVRWLDERATMRSPEIVFEPVVRTFVATEYGVLDYGLGARARLLFPLAPGLNASAGLQAPVLKSDDFEDGEVFEGSNPEAGLDQLLLQYFHKPLPQWAWLWSAGSTQIVQADLRVAALEQLWTSSSGTHQWRTKLMAFDTASVGRTVALGGYTWFSPARRLAVSLTAGKFYTGEGGYRVEVNRWFGDTMIGAFFRAASMDDQAGGFQISLPLTPRRDEQPKGLQIKGRSRWGYSLATTLNAYDQRNPLRPLLLYEPALDLDLRRDFFDGGRLAPVQLEADPGRVLDAAGLAAPAP